MVTLPEIERIAKEATERIAKDFADFGFVNPPTITNGIVRAVLDSFLTPRAADETICTCKKGFEHPYRPGVCGVCGNPFHR